MRSSSAVAELVLRRSVAAALGAVLLVSPAAARGQVQRGFALQRFEPTERGSPSFVVDALDLRTPQSIGAVRPSFGAVVDYAHLPLVVYDGSGTERLALVRHQLVLHAGASFVLLDRVRASVDLPLAMYQDGEDATIGGIEHRGASAPAIGDVRVAGDVRLAGRIGEPVTLAVGMRLWLPTGLPSQFTSDGVIRVAPQVLAAGTIGPFVWGARVAIVARGREEAYAGRQLGSEVFGAASAGVELVGGKVRIAPEVWMSSGFTGDAALLSKRETAIGWILGAHVTTASGLRIGAGAGSGLGPALGSPALRVLASIEWAPPIPIPRVSDRDGDGIADDVDACPEFAGVADADPEKNGCPPPEALEKEDSDADGIFDTDDACPTVPGLRTTDPMTNGCPAGTERPLAVVTKNEIKIGETIQFVTDSADLAGDSEVVLGAVAKLLREHLEIRRLRVEGHTDATGDRQYNEQLSARRAASVTAWLVAHGVEASRVESIGFGSRRPVALNDTEEGRAQNRRVVFSIVERSSP
ncbi:MAG: OmpA family protein [Deltaproteobacteria bacterium]|nr:OmpA family protein [Deltaproteobacteria bacterium]